MSAWERVQVSICGFLSGHLWLYLGQKDGVVTDHCAVCPAQRRRLMKSETVA